MTKKPRVLVYDIEIIPHKLEVFAWDPYTLIGAPVNYKILEVANIVTIAAKFMHEKEVFTFSVDAKNPRCDKKLLKDFLKLTEQADAMVGHYSDKFDKPFVNQRLLANRLPTLPIIKHLDSYKLFKNKFLNRWSNKLDYIAKLLGHEGKIKTEWKLWEDVMKGSQSALDKMLKYNKMDVVQLEKILIDLWPHIDHNINMKIKDYNCDCPSCGGNKVRKRGTIMTLKHAYQRYQCQDCGKWYKGEKV